MSSPNPPDLLIVQVSVNTSGTANTDVTTQVLAAAGFVNKRYRLWAASLSGVPNNTGKLALEIKDANLVLAGRLASLVGGDDYQSWPGGLAMPANVILNIIHRSDVATQILRFQLYYTIELGI